MNGKSEKIEDVKEVWKIRWQGVRVIAKGMLVAAALTAAIMFIP